MRLASTAICAFLLVFPACSKKPPYPKGFKHLEWGDECSAEKPPFPNCELSDDSDPRTPNFVCEDMEFFGYTSDFAIGCVANKFAGYIVSLAEDGGPTSYGDSKIRKIVTFFTKKWGQPDRSEVDDGVLKWAWHEDGTRGGEDVIVAVAINPILGANPLRNPAADVYASMIFISNKKLADSLQEKYTEESASDLGL